MCWWWQGPAAAPCASVWGCSLQLGRGPWASNIFLLVSIASPAHVHYTSYFKCWEQVCQVTVPKSIQVSILVMLFSSSWFVCPLLSRKGEFCLMLVSQMLALKMSWGAVLRWVHLASPFPQQKERAEPLNSCSKQMGEKIVTAPSFRLIVFLMSPLLYRLNSRREVFHKTWYKSSTACAFVVSTLKCCGQCRLPQKNQNKTTN